MTFAELLRTWPRPLVLYEVIPPPRSAPREEVADTAEFVATLLADQPVDAINVPDVRNESRQGNRQAAFMQKLEPRQFARSLQDVFQDGADLIVNHGTVYEPESAQRDWLKDTFTKFNLPNLVLVGGESSNVDYPGPSVGACARLAREVGQETGTDPALGGITIPTRRRATFDEPERMLAKIEAGIEFFTSQVIFEAESSCRLLADYDAACEQAGVKPAPIFLSFAPITGRKDLGFLTWLGVEVPGTVEAWVLDTRGHALERSVRVAEHVLHEILRFADRQDLSVPIGINVEHVMRYNFEASEVLLDHLTSLLDWHAIEQRYTPKEPSP
ncbi:MAG: hypothetical protein R3185_09210 [Candidatus Thermoplasmatota archaeon]|nr:hypothetical protein [Candidatus Thermoplasmatota archaeon]